MKLLYLLYFCFAVKSYFCFGAIIRIPAMTIDQCDFDRGKAFIKNITERFSRCSNFDGFWAQVAFLDMSNSSQLCPTAWNTVVVSSSIRACGRQQTRTYPAATLYSLIRTVLSIHKSVAASMDISMDHHMHFSLHTFQIEGLTVIT